jgi:hypothetical protein
MPGLNSQSRCVTLPTDLQNDLSPALEKPKSSDIRKAARRALAQLLEPLAGFVLDSGLSTSEVHALFREAAVRSAAARQLEHSDRINISGIAAITGIPRADISRILKTPSDPDAKDGDRQHQSTNRILAAWHENPKFTGPDGQPAELPVYGRGATFETLARKYGRGIPTRAVLDELIRSGAVDIVDAQKIRAKATITVERGMSARGVKDFGDRAAELLSTMLMNMRQPETPKFVASVSESAVSVASLPLFQKELAIKAADFLADVQDSLKRKPTAKSSRARSKESARVSVTIFYHEVAGTDDAATPSAAKRRYLRRQT